MFKKLLFSALFMTGVATAAPVSFSSQPTFPQTVTPSGTATLTYTLQNNVPVAHPLSFSATVTAGSIAATGGTCTSTLAASGSCTKIYTYTAPASGTASGSVTVNYDGQYSLTDNSLSFSISSGGGGTKTIVVSPSPAGVAVGGISTTVNHAGTEQFTATEINGDGTVNSGATFTWTSSDTSKATINSSSGLATGVAAGTTTITAKDSSDASISGTSTLTVKAIGASQSSGLVYCMGTGTDITNCPYLAAGKIGGVIYTSDSSTGIRWYNGSYTTTNAISPNDGSANTAAIISNQGATTTTYAAGKCTAIGSGWYLPARNELATIFGNVLALNTASANLNVTGVAYWSSTEYTASPAASGGSENNYAWDVSFNNGFQYIGGKDNTLYVRCAQAF